jgi:DNA-binding LacI/PurR family transcriptional regulator
VPAPFQILSPSEQLAAHLREELRRCRWTGTMPGQAKLVAELGVGTETVRNALVQLEEEGLLVSQGKRRRRRIVLPGEPPVAGLRVRLLPHDRENSIAPYVLDFVRLAEEAGHRVEIQSKTLQDLKNDPDLVARHVKDNPADAWVVLAALGGVLKWFASQPTPAFALFGRISGIDIASVNVRPFDAIRRLLDRLMDHGHRRIVWIVRRDRREPEPAALEQFFLDHLTKRGIPTGRAYHLPEWTETPEGLEEALGKLFELTPPTALIVTEPQLFLAVQNSVVRRGFKVPADISLVCMDVFEGDPSLAWMTPRVSHYRWRWRSVSRRLMRWLDNVARGRVDRRQVRLDADCIEGETIGPVKNTSHHRNP